MSKESIALRRLIVVMSKHFSFSLKRLDQSIAKQSKIKFSWPNFDQSLSKTLNLLEGGLAKVLMVRSRTGVDGWKW